MKTYFFLYLVFSFVFFSFNQEDYKLVSVEFFKYGKRLEKVQYYYLRKDTAVLLPYNSDKIKIDKKLLNTPYFIIVAVYKQTIISFRIETNSFDYIKINAY